MAGLAQAGAAQVVKDRDGDLERIDVAEKLGQKIPLDLTFIDDRGREVTLGQFFDQGKPVVLTLGYYECPMLCNLVFNGLSEAVKTLDWTAGEEFQMLTVGIDPAEGYELAHAKKLNYLKSMETPQRQINDSAWVFMVGAEDQSRALADAVGFRYFYDADRDEYAHPAVVVLLAEDGTITRYLYGIEFGRQDLRLALLETSKGKIGDTIDRILLYCFHYDPDAEGYVVVAGNVMRIGGGLAALILALFIGAMWLGERRKKRLAKSAVKAPVAKR